MIQGDSQTVSLFLRGSLLCDIKNCDNLVAVARIARFYLVELDATRFQGNFNSL
jgi:hypothetical protein